MWIPPIGLRRIVIDPLIFLFALASVLISPILFLGGLIADAVTGGSPWRFLRMTRLYVMFMAAEVIGLVWALILWVASGFGYAMRRPRFVRANYRLLSWWLRVMSREVRAALGLQFVIPVLERIEGPVIVFSRHAGPGDSIFIASVLLDHFDRYPRIVGKKELEFSPLFDVLGHRLPMRFIRPHPKRREVALDAVRDASSHLADRDAFVLFPEGGNFTPKRRAHLIERFEADGRTADAAYAASLRNVLAPHPSGPLAAMAASPNASVVFVAHTGTEDLITVPIIWRGIPFGRKIHVNYWHVPRATIPASDRERIVWLNEQWAAVDRWIGEHRVTDTAGGAP
jgi:hypothetical protein